MAALTLKNENTFKNIGTCRRGETQASGRPASEQRSVLSFTTLHEVDAQQTAEFGTFRTGKVTGACTAFAVN